MFTVGEFSRLAHVSKRLLRYYDEIGLLIPIHIDPITRYRYYSAEQMLDLNRILALKELGLSLDQVRDMLADHISMDEMQGMLLLRKAEIEQQVRAEQQRIHIIESRLQAIRQAEDNQPLNVVLKQVPPQSVLNLRTIVADYEAGLELFGQVRKALPDLGLQYCICHVDSHVEIDMDLEIGVIVDKVFREPVALGGDLKLCPDELPGAETMASIVVKGALDTIHMSYTQVGLWMEQAGYSPAGMARELTLQAPHATDGSDLISEIQFPVKPAEWSSYMSLGNIILVLAGTLTGLSARVYYTFNVGVVPALRSISPKAHIEFMQLLNARIENPLFFLSFFGPAILVPLSAFLFRDDEMFLLLAIAALLHIFGVIGVTGLGNIPLNNKLADVKIEAISDEEADKIRQEYQGPGTPWMRWHNVRTLASIGATALVFIVCLSV